MSLGLYVHIPFCSAICNYCNFNRGLFDPALKARYVEALLQEIRAAGVLAILSEVQFNDAAAKTIADETGATIVSELYTDSLGDPPVDSYEELIRWDSDRILAAFR